MSDYVRRAALRQAEFAEMANDLIMKHQLKQQRMRPPPVAEPVQQAAPPDEMADIANELLRRLAIKDKGL